jgi:hypothetical protein
MLTFWVEFQKEPDGKYLLLNVYKHRMRIEE